MGGGIGREEVLGGAVLGGRRYGGGGVLGGAVPGVLGYVVLELFVFPDLARISPSLLAV